MVGYAEAVSSSPVRKGLLSRNIHFDVGSQNDYLWTLFVHVENSAFELGKLAAACYFLVTSAVKL